MSKPEQKPEGRIIGDKIKNDPTMTIRGIARDVGLSEARVRQIINGYASAGRGQYVEVYGPTDTVAGIAISVGLTPEDLIEAGRHDVAQAMRRRTTELADPEMGRGDALWRQVVAQDVEIREWAEEPFISMPPDHILELFPDDSLLGEIGRRLAHGSMFADGVSTDDTDDADGVTSGSAGPDISGEEAARQTYEADPDSGPRSAPADPGPDTTQPHSGDEERRR